MEFLKKNYEKLILLVLLVVSIGSMFHVLTIIKQTGEVKESDLMIPTREPDYVPKPVDDPVFNTEKTLLDTSLVWVNPGPRKKENEHYYSDLMVMYSIARCPFCEKLIPRYFMEMEKVCPLCENKAGEGKGEPFKKPVIPDPRDVFPRAPTDDDNDGDWMPNDYEIANGLDPNNPWDAFYDPDGDGFSNLYEYLEGTNPKNARVHPPLWRRLHVQMVGKVDLKFRFKRVDAQEGTDESQWEIQITNDRGEGDFASVGSMVEIDKKSFRIVKVERKMEGNNDRSVLHLKEEGGNLELALERDTPVKSFEDKAVMVDSFLPKDKIVAGVGEDIRLGDRRTGTESYRVRAIDLEKRTVLLQDPSFFEGSEGDPTLDKWDLRKNPSVKTPMLVTERGHIDQRKYGVREVRPEDQNRSEFGGPEMYRPQSPPRRPIR